MKLDVTFSLDGRKSTEILRLFIQQSMIQAQEMIGYYKERTPDILEKIADERADPLSEFFGKETTHPEDRIKYYADAIETHRKLLEYLKVNPLDDDGD